MNMEISLEKQIHIWYSKARNMKLASVQRRKGEGIMMTIEEMKQRKARLGITNEELARRSGVPLGTVQKVLGGTTRSPRYETLRKLEEVLADTKEQRSYTYSHYGTMMVGQPPAAYGNGKPIEKRQGEYTLEDYYALPEDCRYELIDGVLFEMNSPATVHQALIGLLHLEFAQFVRENKGPCKVFLSPFDVRLDMDDRTMVEPDLLVICSRDRIGPKYCKGAPDLAVEVLSPSTKLKDMKLKTRKYKNAGVREYWIVDPDTRVILVYDFEKEEFPVIYGFDDKIPVQIWEGKLEVDFARISEEIAYLYEESNLPEGDGE